jgi:hypothetical protein
MRAIVAAVLLLLTGTAHADCDQVAKAACVKQPKSFPDVVMVGKSGGERGCRYTVLYQCKKAPKDFARRAMKTAGWDTADAATKETLALAWLTEVQGVVVTSIAGEGLPPAQARKIGAPTSTVDKHGALTLQYWTAEPGYYRRHKASFDRHGVIKKIRDSDRIVRQPDSL